MLELIDAIVTVIGKVGGDGLGRTALQKIVYFLKAKGLTDAEYYAYYYGPYSAEVKGTLTTLVAYGFVEEKMEFIPRGQRIYKYTLTPDGEALLQKKIDKESKEQVEQIKEVVNAAEEYSPSLKAEDISIPAKSYFVLVEEGKGEAMKPTEIKEIAHKLGWKVEDSQIEESVKLLSRLGLVTVEVAKEPQ